MNRKALGVVIAILAIGGIAVSVFALQSNDSNDNATTPTTTTTTTTPTDQTHDDHQSSQQQSNTTGDTNNDTSGSDAAQTNSVTISDFAFGPETITVKKGTTVTWTNNDSTEHTVTADSGNGPDSPLLAKGKRYSFTFNTAGRFEYHCKPHPYMTGRVVVTE